MDRIKALALKICSAKAPLFIFFWVGIIAVYFPSYKSGFVAEFLGMFADIRRVTFPDFINRTDAEVKSFYQLTQLQLFVLIKVFGIRFIPWFLLTTALHAFNGLLVFTFFRDFFRDFAAKSAVTIAFAGTLFFLFNPNITEVTIWKGGYHYLTGLMMQMAILLWTQRFLHTGERKYLLLCVTLFLLSMFTLEIFYLTPVFVFALIHGYNLKKLIDRETCKTALTKIFLPQVMLFATHLLMFRLVYGSWIAHYGTSATFTTSVPEMLPRAGKYLSYLLFMVGQMPENIRLSVYSQLGHPVVSYGLCLVVIIATVGLIINFKKLKPGLQIATFLLTGLIFSLILIIPIYFDDLFSLYNSRRCYQAGLFAYMLLSWAIVYVVGNIRVRHCIFFGYLFICLAFTGRKVIHWRTAARVQYILLRDLPVRQTDTVLLLNLPCYYKDIRTIAANEDNEFLQQQSIFGIPLECSKIYSVSSYNMKKVWNGAHVTVIDSNHIKVTLNQWGTWWMYNYLGAASYENELYRVDMTDPGHEYHLYLKKVSPNIAILYQQDLKWKKVDMSSSGEQW